MAAASLLAVTDVGYLAIMRSQNSGPLSARAVFIAVFVAAMAVAALGGAFLPRGVSGSVLLPMAAAGSFSLGVLAILSIGALILVASVLLLVAWMANPPEVRARQVRAAIAAAAAGVALLIVGLGLTG